MRDVIDFQAVETDEGTNELACLGRSRSTQKAYDLSVSWFSVNLSSGRAELNVYKLNPHHLGIVQEPCLKLYKHGDA